MDPSSGPTPRDSRHGQRGRDSVLGTDVLTVRHLEPDQGAWRTALPAAPSQPTLHRNVKQRSTSPDEPRTAVADFKSRRPGHACGLLECSGVRVVKSGGTATPDPTTEATLPCSSEKRLSAPKVFDFNHDYQTVTYYVRWSTTARGPDRPPPSRQWWREQPGGARTMNWSGASSGSISAMASKTPTATCITSTEAR